MLEMTDMMLVDAALDAYVDWREEEAVVRSAYRRWMRASARPDRVAACVPYTACLDREERACGLHAAAILRNRRFFNLRWRASTSLHRVAGAYAQVPDAADRASDRDPLLHPRPQMAT
jgi:hypothetical protein